MLKKQSILPSKGMIGQKDSFYTVSSLPLPGNSDAATGNISTPKRYVKCSMKF